MEKICSLDKIKRSMKAERKSRNFDYFEMGPNSSFPNRGY